MIERHRMAVQGRYSHLVTEQIGPVMNDDCRAKDWRLHFRGLLYYHDVTQRRQVGRNFGKCRRAIVVLACVPIPCNRDKHFRFNLSEPIDHTAT